MYEKILLKTNLNLRGDYSGARGHTIVFGLLKDKVKFILKLSLIALQLCCRRLLEARLTLAV